ncbi:hypothetical protein CWATWH0401_294 [Crocosphaera watsonii WH 0401]|uniref:Uncharacterized protein n=1 Tax=Crocosphaera watsonii WH 0401 TaxID=555881 RepID=T2J5D2_CROWT|nr:hypothetical protein CWATWH0401_294 [Crocosphaera watsonii WH 0401]
MMGLRVKHSVKPIGMVSVYHQIMAKKGAFYEFLATYLGDI